MKLKPIVIKMDKYKKIFLEVKLKTTKESEMLKHVAKDFKIIAFSENGHLKLERYIGKDLWWSQEFESILWEHLFYKENWQAFQAMLKNHTISFFEIEYGKHMRLKHLRNIAV